MNAAVDKICVGCLCGDRKMVPLINERKRHCFFNLLNETQVPNCNSVPVFLCWECEALNNKFEKFRQQVNNANKILNNCLILGLSVKQIPYTPHLQTQVQATVSFYPDTPQEEPIQFKFEPDLEPEVHIKQEPDHSDHYSEDDKVLIEFTDKRSKIVAGKRKKKKKKVLEPFKEVKLSLKEVDEERRLMELKDDYVNALFRCGKCVVSFANGEDLKDHLRIKHELNASYLLCDVCECSFRTDVSYKYHMNKHTVRFQCTLCAEISGSKRAATTHYDVVHCHRTEFDYDVAKTPLRDGDVTVNGDTVISKAEVASYPCESCAKVFRWKTSLRKHAETHRIETGQKRQPYCEYCRLSFATTSNLQKHVKTSTKHQIELKLRKLQESQPLDSNPDKRAARIQQITNSVISKRKLHNCPQCDKTFQWRGNLLRHLHSHAARANGGLVCEPCKRSFSSIATFKQHMQISRKHVSENDFKFMCSDCGKRFADKTRLKDHVNWEHLKNYVHTCGLCKKIFKSHTSLYLHKQVVHKENKAEHLCDHCGKPFPNQAKLRCHITAVHSGAQPYRCSSCPARFSWHSCLARHVRRRHPPQDH